MGASVALTTLFCLVSASLATIGVDVSQAVSESQWKCLQTPGGQGPVTFAIVRVYQSVGHVDEMGLTASKQQEVLVFAMWMDTCFLAFLRPVRPQRPK